jgi:phosphoglycolate phosphatase
MTAPIDLVCLDLAGTTVSDDGVVEDAFLAALNAVRPNQPAGERSTALAYIIETMGQSKIAVFRALFADEEDAQAANAAFEDAYGHAVLEQGLMPIEGAEATIKALRDAGRKVCLLTGFSKATRDLVIDALGWRDIADLALCPAEAGRGRPHPNIVLTQVS